MDTPDSTTSKRCTKCGEFRPRDHYCTDRSKRDGLSSQCRACRTANARHYRAENADRVRERQRNWRANNSAEVRERQLEHRRERYAENRESEREYARKYMKLWREQHPLRAKEAAQKWRAKNRDYIKQKNAEYHAMHAEELAEYKRARREVRRDSPDYKARVKAYKARRRALERGASGNFTPEDIHALHRAQTGKDGRLRCWWCGKPIEGTAHLDHKHPLSRGGTNDIGNLALTCAQCNLSKSVKTPSEWTGRLL